MKRPLWVLDASVPNRVQLGKDSVQSANFFGLAGAIVATPRIAVRALISDRCTVGAIATDSRIATREPCNPHFALKSRHLGRIVGNGHTDRDEGYFKESLYTRVRERVNENNLIVRPFVLQVAWAAPDRHTWLIQQRRAHFHESRTSQPSGLLDACAFVVTDRRLTRKSSSMTALACYPIGNPVAHLAELQSSMLSLCQVGRGPRNGFRNGPALH